MGSLNKNTSTWRGSDTPPTIFHRWEKQDIEGTYIGTFLFNSRLSVWEEIGKAEDSVLYDLENNVPLREGATLFGTSPIRGKVAIAGFDTHSFGGGTYEHLTIGDVSENLRLRTNTDPIYGTSIAVDVPGAVETLVYDTKPEIIVNPLAMEPILPQYFTPYNNGLNLYRMEDEGEILRVYKMGSQNQWEKIMEATAPEGWSTREFGGIFVDKFDTIHVYFLPLPTDWELPKYMMGYVYAHGQWEQLFALFFLGGFHDMVYDPSNDWFVTFYEDSFEIGSLATIIHKNGNVERLPIKGGYMGAESIAYDRNGKLYILNYQGELCHNKMEAIDIGSYSSIRLPFFNFVDKELYYLADYSTIVRLNPNTLYFDDVVQLPKNLNYLSFAVDSSNNIYISSGDALYRWDGEFKEFSVLPGTGGYRLISDHRGNIYAHLYRRDGDEGPMGWHKIYQDALVSLALYPDVYPSWATGYSLNQRYLIVSDDTGSETMYQFVETEGEHLLHLRQKGAWVPYTPSSGGIEPPIKAVKVDGKALTINPIDSSVDIINKVDKVPGKNLSTNDYTTLEKNKLGNLAAYVTDIELDGGGALLELGVNTMDPVTGKTQRLSQDFPLKRIWDLSKVLTDPASARLMYNGADVGDWLYTASDGTKKGGVLSRVSSKDPATSDVDIVYEMDGALRSLHLWEDGRATDGAITLDVETLPLVPISKGGTGAVTSIAACHNLKIAGCEAPSAIFPSITTLDVVEVGTWQVASDVVLTNAPVENLSYRVHTYAINGGADLVQEVVCTKGTFTRSFTDSNWGGWSAPAALVITDTWKKYNYVPDESSLQLIAPIPSVIKLYTGDILQIEGSLNVDMEEYTIIGGCIPFNTKVVVPPVNGGHLEAYNFILYGHKLLAYDSETELPYPGVTHIDLWIEQTGEGKTAIICSTGLGVPSTTAATKVQLVIKSVTQVL